jgi:hypothetical protein
VSAPDGTVAWRLGQLERTVAELEQKIDRLMWALTIAALSFAGASAVLVLNLLTLRR